MFKLFHCPGACSLAPLIALEEAGAPYETVIVNLGAGDQARPEYLAINPKAKVPALVTDRGVLTENPAILTFIAQSFPDARLAPLNDPFELARMQSFNAYLASAVQPSAGPIVRPFRFTDEEAAQPGVKTKAIETYVKNLGLVEKDLLAGPWVLGEDYSVSDAYLFVFSGSIERLNLDKALFPRLLEHRARMSARPAVQRAVAVT